MVSPIGRKSNRRRPAPIQVTPRPLNEGESLRGIVREELQKALALPAGATSTQMTTGYMQALQRRNMARPAQSAALTRDPNNNYPFGPGEPLIPAPIAPLLPSGRPAPQRWDYPVSWNLQTTTTRLVPWTVLRDVAAQVPVVRACIDTCKSALTGLDWSFSIDSSRARALAKRSNTSSHAVIADLQDKYADDIDRLHTWWQKPDRINNLNFVEWLSALLEDEVVLDAISVYPHLTLGGDLYAAELIDSSMIKPLLDDRGAIPQPPYAAYQQIRLGFPRGEFSQFSSENVDQDFVSAVYGPTSGIQARTDALIYKVRNQRTNSPYGFSAVEKALPAVDLWLKRWEWLSAEYSSGVTPEMMVKVGGNYTPEQLQEWEAVYNDDLSGRTAERHRARFLPADFEPWQPTGFDAKFANDLDLHIIRLICAALDVLPTSLGFTPNHGMGGSGGQGHQQGESDCYSENVEVLTRSGWKKFQDVDIAVDEFATRNPKTRAFEWQWATHKTVADFDGEMIRFFNGRTLDITVSPNHRMLVHNTGRHDTEFILPAHEAAGRPCRIPVLSEWDAPDLERFELPASGVTNSKPFSCSGDDFAAFMGMYLAEGCPSPYGVQIAQMAKSKGFPEFRDLVERLTGQLPKHSGGRYMRVFSAALRDYCVPLGKSHTKFVPDIVKNMSKRQLEIFFHYYWLGDGWAGTNGQPRMATASKRLADDLQEIAQKIGYGSGITIRKPGKGYREDQHPDRWLPMYHLALRQTKHVSYRTEKVPYAGKIYCVTVPNEILYVRDNGQPLWCGNSQLQRGTKPRAKWVINLINEISINYLGMPPEVTFGFHGLDDEDEQKKATLLQGYIGSGLMVTNEGRDALNLPRYAIEQANEPYIATPTGPSFLNPEVQPSGMPGNLPSAHQNGPNPPQVGAPDKPAIDAGASNEDRDEQVQDVPDAKTEQKAFMTFARRRRDSGWRDFTFKTLSPDIAQAANDLASVGELDAVKALFDMQMA